VPTISIRVRDVTILAVDDYRAFRDVLRSVIAAAPGFLFIGEAGSGEEAIRAVDVLSPQLV
jgi:chemotaxis response regulator CheB